MDFCSNGQSGFFFKNGCVTFVKNRLNSCFKTNKRCKMEIELKFKFKSHRVTKQRIRINPKVLIEIN